MSLDPVSTPDSTMPSEVFFKKQAGRVQKALSNFKLVSSLPDASTLIRAAMTELVDATVRLFIFLPSPFIFSCLYQDAFNGFLSHISHPLFQELPISVQTTLDDFLTKNPKFDVPKNFHRIAGLVARIQDSAGHTQTPARRSSAPSSLLAVPGRPERIRRPRVPVSQSFSLDSSTSFNCYF